MVTENKEKPVDFQGPFQFGEWLKVDLRKSKLSLRRKPSIVYADKEQGKTVKEGMADYNMGLHEEKGRGIIQTDKGKLTSTSNVRLRTVKRTLKGKNEVCYPIAPEKSKTTGNFIGNEDEISEATSPIKISVPTVEAGSQPRRDQ
ncbi:hypothetical protein V6N13_082620 [Hibiscus sabdariffa]